MYTCLIFFPFIYNTCIHIFGMLSVYSPMAMCMPDMCNLQFNLLISLFMSFSNVNGVPKTLLNFLWSSKHSMCTCMHVYYREYIFTHIHMYICFTCVPSFVISLLIQCGGAERTLCGPHNVQTFFQLACPS